MKKALSLLLAVLTIGTVLLTACGGPNYKTDEAPSSLMQKALQKVQGDPSDYTEPESDFIPRNIGELNGLTDSSLRLHKVSSNFSEAGIFRLEDGDKAKEAEKAVRAYIEKQQDYLKDFLSQYEAAEVEKINNAQVRTYGVYVVYAFLTKSDATAFFGEIEAALTA